MTAEEHKEKILCATRGSIGDYVDAVIDAVIDGHTHIMPASDVVWAQRVIKQNKPISRRDYFAAHFPCDEEGWPASSIWDAWIDEGGASCIDKGASTSEKLNAVIAMRWWWADKMMEASKK